MAMWISRKIAAINKPLPPVFNQTSDHINPLVVVVVGDSNVGKSTLIRFGLQDLIAKHDSNRPDLQCHHTNIMLDRVDYPLDVIEIEPSMIDLLTETIHGGLVCYDTTNKSSLACIPDLLDYFTSRHIPTFLIGLKSDLVSSCQVVPDLDFSIQHYRVDTFSEDGVQRIQNIYKDLLGQYDPLLSQDREEIKTRPNTLVMLTDEYFSTDHNGSTCLHMVNKKERNSAYSSHYTHLSSRRGSKDSSDSFNIGLTPDDIVDRLLFIEYSKADENIIPIFLTFFRKFMKPYELVQKLVERFEEDGLSSDESPTELQKRIHSIFTLWLSHYWNDFYGSHARQNIILFLDRISKYESLTPICDSLAPLVVREPPIDDPDKAWGLVDDQDQITTRKKKDSGYASGFNFSPTRHEFMLKSNPSSPRNTVIEPALLSPNLNRLLSRRKQVSHSESHPDLRSSYHTTEFPRLAEFAGGIINIDTILHQSQRTSVMTPSIATTHGNDWNSSFGHHFASSLISSFRQHRNDKDQASFNYKTFMKASDHAIADQLTWIEAELFTRIKPREFIRNIWNSSSCSSSNNTVMASIAHFNFISAWLVTMIVTQSRLSKRVALLQKFMLIAVELRNRNNYNTLMAILAGINSAAVLRLKQTRQVVSTKKVYKQFQSLERLMSTDRSFSSYRMALKASDAPGIPYLGIHNQDLVSLAEANKDFRTDGSVHWEKFRLMGETIMATMKFKYPGYAIEPDAKLLTFIADCYILSEDEQYRRSTLIEPKLASTNTNRIRDLWLRL